MRIKKEKIFDIGTEGYEIPKTDILLLPYCEVLSKTKTNSMYEMDWDNNIRNALMALENNAPGIYKNGYFIYNDNDKPLTYQGKMIVFDYVEKKTDLSVDKNGNLMLKAHLIEKNNNHTIHSKSFYMLLNSYGEILEVSERPIIMVGENRYRVSSPENAQTFFYIVTPTQSKTADKTKKPVKLLKDLTKTEQNQNIIYNSFTLKRTSNRFYYLSDIRLKDILPETKEDCDPTIFHNGYAFGSIIDAHISKNFNGINSHTVESAPFGLKNYFIDLYGNYYISFIELLKQDYKLRKLGKTPIIQDLDLLYEEIKCELLKLEEEIKNRFGNKKIDKKSRQNYSTKERNAVVPFDKAYNELLEIMTKIEDGLELESSTSATV